MNLIIKNILLLLVVFILSYFTAEYFGFIYDYFTPGSLGGNSWIGTTTAWQSIIGTPFAYIFFTTLLFQSFGFGNRNKWTLWFLSPALLFFASGDLKHIYLPIALALIAFGLAVVARTVLAKLYTGKTYVRQD